MNPCAQIPGDLGKNTDPTLVVLQPLKPALQIKFFLMFSLFQFVAMSLKVVELDCKTVGFFLKISKEFGKAWRKSLTRAKRASLTRPPQSRSLFSALFQTFCLTARAYLNTQKYGLFCSL